ncbi:hypothetical protein JTB14_008899, partial [Gonioctena quinquepunctata]
KSLIILSSLGIIPPTKVGFYCKDPSLSHKYTGDTITPEILFSTAVPLALVIIMLTEILIHHSFRKINYYRILFLLKECMVGFFVVLFLTSMAKTIFGEHRPHFLDVCQPDTAINCIKGDFINTFTCTTYDKYTNYFITDSSLSFPSGHASISWFLGMYLSFIVRERLPTVRVGALMKPFLISVCLIWSLVCSLTRITDRRHHWWDVLAGAIIGIAGSFHSINLVRRKFRKMSNTCEDNKKTLSELA